MRRFFFITLFFLLIFSGLFLTPTIVDAACYFDEYGECGGTCSCPEAGQIGCYCRQLGSSCRAETNQCEGTSDPTPTGGSGATSTPQPTSRPTQAPCQPGKIQCENGLCCDNGYYCCQSGCGGSSYCCCRVGAVSPTNVPNGRTCGQLCNSNYPCVSGLSCISNYCRNPNCEDDNDCVCPPTPTPVSCNGLCTSTDDCVSGLVCATTATHLAIPIHPLYNTHG